jgi:hypothetical protein
MFEAHWRLLLWLLQLLPLLLGIYCCRLLLTEVGSRHMVSFLLVFDSRINIVGILVGPFSRVNFFLLDLFVFVKNALSRFVFLPFSQFDLVDAIEDVDLVQRLAGRLLQRARSCPGRFFGNWGIDLLSYVNMDGGSVFLSFFGLKLFDEGLEPDLIGCEFDVS